MRVITRVNIKMRVVTRSANLAEFRAYEFRSVSDSGLRYVEAVSFGDEWMRIGFIAVAILTLTACSQDSASRAVADLESWVQKGKVGADADRWIEMKNNNGEWERVGLIFGYYGDEEECQKAIAGMKKVNFSREYRCTQANL